jgi:hypothetical protein
MLYDTFATKLFNCSISFDCDETILNVKLPQTTAIVGNRPHSLVSHKFTTLNAELFQIWTVLGQQAKTSVGNVALAKIQSSKTGAGTR